MPGISSPSLSTSPPSTPLGRVADFDAVELAGGEHRGLREHAKGQGDVGRGDTLGAGEGDRVFEPGRR